MLACLRRSLEGALPEGRLAGLDSRYARTDSEARGIAHNYLGMFPARLVQVQAFDV
jgi:hypothetical protein